MPIAAVAGAAGDIGTPTCRVLGSDGTPSRWGISTPIAVPPPPRSMPGRALSKTSIS